MNYNQKDFEYLGLLIEYISMNDSYDCLTISCSYNYGEHYNLVFSDLAEIPSIEELCEVKKKTILCVTEQYATNGYKEYIIKVSEDKEVSLGIVARSIQKIQV